jgi:hypothetical protein
VGIGPPRRSDHGNHFMRLRYFDISDGRMTCWDSGAVVHDSTGWVSGVGGACQNNPDATCTSQKDIGPVPPGHYDSTGPPSHRPPSTTRRNMTPDGMNDMFGRSDFQTHYCPNPMTCSNGCPAQTDWRTMQGYNNLLDANPGTPITVAP